MESISEEEKFEKVLELSKRHLEGEKASGFDHSLRVKNLAEHIGKKVDADLSVVRLSALLHDVGVPEVGREGHFEESARMGSEWLEEIGFFREKIEQVAHVIRSHSRYGGPDPETKEAKVLYDADVLDTIGAIGTIRAICRGIEGGTFTGNVDTVPDFLEKLIEGHQRKLHFEESRKLGEERLEFTRRFVRELKKELEFSDRW